MAEIEKNTNELLRKKYYVEDDSVVSGRKREAKNGKNVLSRIVGSKEVRMGEPISLNRAATGADSIKVSVVRDGDKISKIRISCPCGRHADLDCQYAAE